MTGPDYEGWLKAFLSQHAGVAGTVHLREGDDLKLAAALNIPQPVIDVTRVIPKGKGMAGLALQRDAPVETCNLKDDKTGDVRPGAKAVDAQAAAAIPVHDAGGQVRAVVGIAWAGEKTLSPDELSILSAAAEALP